MMNDRATRRQAEEASAGLCARCRHVQRIDTPRGSRFYLCRLSYTDPRFVRYPALPVLRCPGFDDEDEPAR